MVPRFETRADGVEVVRLGAYVDFKHAAVLRKLCLERVAQGARGFVFDLSDTHVLDSSGLGALFNTYRTLGRAGSMALVGVPQDVAPVIRLTRTYKVMPVMPSLEAAIARVTAAVQNAQA